MNWSEVTRILELDWSCVKEQATAFIHVSFQEKMRTRLFALGWWRLWWRWKTFIVLSLSCSNTNQRLVFLIHKMIFSPHGLLSQASGRRILQSWYFCSKEFFTFDDMRCIVILYFVAFVTLSNAQVVNSLSKDKTGFYGHALDSVISIIKENKAVRTVYVGGRECVKAYLPERVQGVIVKWNRGMRL